MPVRVEKIRQNKKLEPRSDSIGTGKALDHRDTKAAPVFSRQMMLI
jgi:hypothetical protein